MKKNFNIKKIKKAVPGELFWFDTTTSTNSEAKTADNVPDKSIFLADEQREGRGRLGRNWASQKGEGIFMTIYLEPEVAAENIAQLTLLAGIAVSRVIENSVIKWPNDVLIEGKKVSGILSELVTKSPDKNAVLVGIGINVGTQNFPDELKYKATSLFLETGKKQDRTKIVIALITEFFAMYDRFLKSGIAPFMEEYRKKCATIGRDVIIEEKGEKSEAKAVNVTERGELRVLQNGEEKLISFGEVSVRGLLGYGE